MAMGFGINRCKRALSNTGNNGAEVAMNWLFEHMEDPGKIEERHAGRNPTHVNCACRYR